MGQCFRFVAGSSTAVPLSVCMFACVCVCVCVQVLMLIIVHALHEETMSNGARFWWRERTRSERTALPFIRVRCFFLAMLLVSRHVHYSCLPACFASCLLTMTATSHSTSTSHIGYALKYAIAQHKSPLQTCSLHTVKLTSVACDLCARRVRAKTMRTRRRTRWRCVQGRSACKTAEQDETGTARGHGDLWSSYACGQQCGQSCPCSLHS